MSGFLTSFFRVILGWMKTAASWLWSVFFDQSDGHLGGWLSEHWLILTVIVCLCGLAIDFFVNLARWRPDLVYRSFFHRLFGGSEKRDNETRRKQKFSESTSRAWTNIRQSMKSEDAEDLSYHPAETGMNPRETYNAPYVPPQWNRKNHDGR